MRSFLRSSKLTFVLLGFLLLTFLAVIVPRVIAFQDNFIPTSTVEVSSQDNLLKFQFQIIEADKAKVSELSRKLEVTESWTEGISLTIDQQSAKYIQQFLPLKAKIRFERQGVRLLSSSFSLWNQARLRSAVADTQFEYATASARLYVVQKGSEEVQVLMSQPDVLLKEATLSGKLTVSPDRLSQLLPLLGKLDTMKLQLEKGQLNGELLLK